MKLGIKEFRERISELALGDETVVLTHHGRRVGRYIPDRFTKPKLAPAEAEAWAREMNARSREWRTITPDWKDRLRSAGFADDEITELEAGDRAAD